MIQKFKKGEYNLLVSTSIGEEGLDIGEIDLIVCYDAQKTPIRMVCGIQHRIVRIVLKQPSFNESDVRVANARAVSMFSSPRVVKKQTGTRRRRHTNRFNISLSAVTS